MKVLITEDNDRKYNEIESVILELFPDAIIKRATFVEEALKLYLNKADDQIVFDVLVPILNFRIFTPPIPHSTLYKGRLTLSIFKPIFYLLGSMVLVCHYMFLNQHIDML